MDLKLDKLTFSDETSEKGWFDIMPYELRSMIIDIMDIQSKCRFAICSKKCEDEVEVAGFGVGMIRIVRYDSSSIYIRIFTPTEGLYRKIMFFESCSTKTFVKCEGFEPKRVIWEKKEIGTLFDVIPKYVNVFIRTGPKSLKGLGICMDDLIDDVNRRIKHLKNLEYIELKKEVDLRIPNPTVNQVFQIKATFDEIVLDDLNWELWDIQQFLARCIDGELNENVETFYLTFNDLSLDEKIFENLNILKVDIVEVAENEFLVDHLFEYKNRADFILSATILDNNLMSVWPRAFSRQEYERRFFE